MTGVFSGSPDDHRDGFIHLSTAEQLQATLDKHYKQAGDLVLAEVMTKGLGAPLKYEISRGGEPFPHLYADLHIDYVPRHWGLSPGPDGRYAISQYLTGNS